MIIISSAVWSSAETLRLSRIAMFGTATDEYWCLLFMHVNLLRNGSIPFPQLHSWAGLMANALNWADIYANFRPSRLNSVRMLIANCWTLEELFYKMNNFWSHCCCHATTRHATPLPDCWHSISHNAVSAVSALRCRLCNSNLVINALANWLSLMDNIMIYYKLMWVYIWKLNWIWRSIRGASA